MTMEAVDARRALFDARLLEWCAALPAGGLYEPMAYLLGLPAKRVRPLAALMACELFAGDARPALGVALGIELFHNFTLMHDDLMDASPTRRGRPTVHARWNGNTAILSGDALLVKAYECMAGDARALPVFNRYALQVCEGQALDMAYEQRNDVTAQEYMEMIRLKTAVLLACSLELGAMAGGAGEADGMKLARFGERLGLAFQLRDDHIDAFGDPLVSGKQRGGDLRNGKKTWLLIRGLELERGRGEDVLSGQLALASIARDVGIMVDQLVALGVRSESETIIQGMEQEALLLLDELGLDADRLAPMRALAASLMGRRA